MPAKPRWLLRIPQILAQLEQWPAPWLDRSALESLFDLKRRRSIELLHAFGGFQAGRTFLVDRDRVLERLRRIQQGDPFQWERRRRQRLSEGLNHARRYAQARQVLIPASPAPPSWPDGVQLRAGEMTISFQDVSDLLAKLYGLAQAAACDFEAFQTAVAHALPEAAQPAQ